MMPASTCAICAVVSLPALDLLLEELHRLAHAGLERLRGDVLHEDGHALRGRLVGDAAAHDPGAEDGRALHRPGRLRVLLRDPLHGLVAEEDADQRVGGRASSRSSRRPRPRSPAPRRGSCRRPSPSPRWRRPGRGSAGRPCRPRRPSTPRNTIPASIAFELQRGLLLLAPGLPVELAVGRVLQHAERRLAQVGGRHGRVHGADLQGVGGRPLLAAGDPLDRGVGPAQAGEPHGAAPAGEEAELRLRQADLRLRGHRAVARGEAQLEAAAERDAVDRDDGRRVEVLDRGEDGVRVEEPAGELLLALLEVAEELGDVGADEEDVLAARDQDARAGPSGPGRPRPPSSARRSSAR